MPDPDQDLVSVIIPTRNRCTMLRRAIDSVRAQTWPVIEIIVVDDSSSDDTSAVLAAMVREGCRLRVVRNEIAHGGAEARNQGIAVASGHWVAFLDDDDMWLPPKLEKQIALMRANVDASAASCAYFLRRPLTPRRLIQAPAEVTEQQILSPNRLGGASMCLTRRDVLRRVGGFDASLRSGQDWDLWTRLFYLGPIVACQEPLVLYESHRGPRISRSATAAYLGHRRVYFRYRHRMEVSTRGMHMASLLYWRASRSRSLWSGANYLRLVISLVGTRARLRYIAWFLLARMPTFGE